jgi:CRP/FNR family cyclic AMP-dependent transcriptional regulator
MSRQADFAASGFGKRSAPTTGHYRDHQVIFAQGDAANAMFRVMHGHVKLAITSDHRKKASIAILNKGDCFGEGCLLSRSVRTHSATSIHQSTIGRVSKQVMLRRLRAEPPLAKLFVRHLLRRLGRVEDDLVDQIVNTSERRLARLLVQLSGLQKSSGRLPAGVHVDQGTLAQVVGTTRSRVSHFMNEFRKKGFIDYNGSLRVHKSLLDFLANKPGTA